MAHVLTKFFIGPSVGSNNTDIFHTRLNVMGKNKGFSDEYSRHVFDESSWICVYFPDIPIFAQRAFLVRFPRKTSI